MIPVYNREGFIKKSVQSVLNQNYSDFELIVVDDYSSDKSREKVCEFSDSRIKLLELKENGGNAKARNEGWKNAKGEWVVFLDSDDWFEYDYLSRLAEAISCSPESSFFWTGVRYVKTDDSVIKEEFWQPKEALPSSTFFDELRIGTNCGVAFRKELLMRYHGFNESFRASVDREFFLRISLKENGKGIPNILVNCLLGEHESVRKNHASQALAYRTLIDLYPEQIHQSSFRKRWWYHKAMWLHFNSGKRKEAIQYYFKIPFQFKSQILFLIYFFFPLSKAELIHKRIGS